MAIHVIVLDVQQDYEESPAFIHICHFSSLPPSPYEFKTVVCSSSHPVMPPKYDCLDMIYYIIRLQSCVNYQYYSTMAMITTVLVMK